MCYYSNGNLEVYIMYIVISLNLLMLLTTICTSPIGTKKDMSRTCIVEKLGNEEEIKRRFNVVDVESW